MFTSCGINQRARARRLSGMNTCICFGEQPDPIATSLCSSVVIDDLRGSEWPLNAVVFLYCESLDRSKYDTKCLLGNIFGQLLLQLPQPRSSAIDRLVRLYNTFQPFDFGRLLKDISRDYEKVFVVIDSLYESKDPINLLESLPDGWHVFITSLREYSLRDALADYNRLVISSMDNAADIRRFVLSEVRKLKDRNPKLARDVVDELTLDAQGRCVLVSTSNRVFSL